MMGFFLTLLLNAHSCASSMAILWYGLPCTLQVHSPLMKIEKKGCLGKLKNHILLSCLGTCIYCEYNMPKTVT